ncbi:MAG: hypothetical protein AAF725_12255 [Acidobacteriota bacterium]
MPKLRRLSEVVLCLALLAAPLSAFETLTLSPDAAGGIFKPDLQASFPDVDWQTLDRLYLPAGHFKYLRLGNLPTRSADNPLIITNLGGQVRVGGLGHYYVMAIAGGSHWKLTGRYDRDAATGDQGFPGHAAGYANSRSTYGILIDDTGGREGNSCLAIGGGATDFEVEFVEARGCGFAGMTIKTDNQGEATMANVRLHDNYIHDVGSEGFYIGSTQSEPQHTYTDLKIYNNRVMRTGTEMLQLGQLGDGSEIYNNVFMQGALDWKNPFQNFQDNASQYGGRYGTISVHHNIFIGGAQSLLIFFGQDRTGDVHGASDTQSIEHNYFSHGRNVGIYAGRSGDGVSTYRFAHNHFRALDFQYDEVNPNTDHNAVLRLFPEHNPVEVVGNRWDGSQRFALIGSEVDVASESDNLNVEIPPVVFVDSGFPFDFDYLRLEIWTDVDSNDAPVLYEQGDYVTHLGKLYLALAANSGELPPDSPGAWQERPYPADDVRLTVGSPFQGYGLLDNPGNKAFFADNFESGDTHRWSSTQP